MSQRGSMKGGRKSAGKFTGIEASFQKLAVANSQLR